MGQVVDMDKEGSEGLLVGGRRGRRKGMPNIAKRGEWLCEGVRVGVAVWGVRWLCEGGSGCVRV